MKASKQELEHLKSEQMIVEEPERKFRKAVKIYRGSPTENVSVHFRGVKFVPKESIGHQYSQTILSPSPSQIRHILASPEYPLGVVSQRKYFRNDQVILHHRYQILYEMGLTDKDIKRFEEKFWLSKRGIPWSLELDEELQAFLMVKAEEKRRKKRLAALQREIFVDDKKTFMIKPESKGKLKSVDRVMSAEERAVMARQLIREKSRRKSSLTGAQGFAGHTRTRGRSVTKKQIKESIAGSPATLSPSPASSSSLEDLDSKQVSMMLMSSREPRAEQRGVTVLKAAKHKQTKGGKELHIRESFAERMKRFDLVVDSVTGLPQEQPSLLSLRLGGSPRSPRHSKAEDVDKSSTKSSLYSSHSHKDKSSRKSSLPSSNSQKDKSSRKSSLHSSNSQKDKSSRKSSLATSQSQKGSDWSDTSFSSKASMVTDHVQRKDSERTASFTSELAGKPSVKGSFRDLTKERTASFASDLTGKQSRKQSYQDLRKERTASFASDVAGKQSRKESFQDLRKEIRSSIASDLGGTERRKEFNQQVKKGKGAVGALRQTVTTRLSQTGLSSLASDRESVRESDKGPISEDEIFPPKFSLEVENVEEEIFKGLDRGSTSSKTSTHGTSEGKLSVPVEDISQEQSRRSLKSWESIKRRSFLGEKIGMPKAVPQLYLAAKTLQNLWKLDRKIQGQEARKAMENISATNLNKPEPASKWFTGRWDDANQEESPFIKEYINKELERKAHEILSVSRVSTLSSPKGSKTSLTQGAASDHDSDISQVIFKASKETGHKSFDGKMTTALMDKLDDRMTAVKGGEQTSYKKLSVRGSDNLYKMESKSIHLESTRESREKSIHLESTRESREKSIHLESTRESREKSIHLESTRESREKSIHLGEKRQWPRISLEKSSHLDESRQFPKSSLEKSTHLDVDRQFPKKSLEKLSHLDEDRQFPKKSLEKLSHLDEDRQFPKKSLEKLSHLDEDRQLPKQSLGRLEKAVEQLNRYKQIAAKQLEKFEKEEKHLEKKVSAVGKRFSLAVPQDGLKRSSVSFDTDEDEEETEEDRNYKLSIIRSQAEIVVKTEKMNAKIYELTRRKARASLELQLSDDSEDGSVKDPMQRLRKLLSKRGSSLKHMDNLSRTDQASTSRRRTKDSFDTITVGKDEIPMSPFRIDRSLIPKQGDLESLSSSLKGEKSMRPPGYLDDVTSPGGGASAQQEEGMREESRPGSLKRRESFGTPGEFYEKEDVPSLPRKGMTAGEKEDAGLDGFSISRKHSQSFGPSEKLGEEDDMTSLSRKGMAAMMKEETSEERIRTSRKRSKSFGSLEKLREEDDIAGLHRKGVTAMEKEDLGEESLSTSRKRSKAIGPHEKLGEEEDMKSLTRKRKIPKGKGGEKEETLSISPVESKSIGRQEELTERGVTQRLPVRGKLSKGKLRKSGMEEEQPTIPRKKDKPTTVYEEADNVTSPKRGKLSVGKSTIDKESPIGARKDIQKSEQRENISEEGIAVTSPRSGKPSKRRRFVRKTSTALLRKRSSDTQRLDNLVDDIDAPGSPGTSRPAKQRRGRKFDRTPAASKRSAALRRRDGSGEEEEEDDGDEESSSVSSERSTPFERLDKLSAEKDAISPRRRGRIAKRKESRREESLPAARQYGKTTERLEKVGREEDMSSFPRRGKIAKRKVGQDEESLSDVNLKTKSFGRLEKLGQDEDLSRLPMRGKIARGKESKDEQSPPLTRKQGKPARQAEALGDDVSSTERTKKPRAEKQSFKEGKPQISDDDLGVEFPRERRKRTGQGQDRGSDHGEDLGTDQGLSSQRVKSRRERAREVEDAPEIEIEVSGRKGLYRAKLDASLTSVDKKEGKREKQRLLDSDGRLGELRRTRDEDEMAARRQMGEGKRGKTRALFEDIQEAGPKSSGFKDKKRHLTGSPDSIASSGSMFSEVTAETLARLSDIPHPSIDSLFQSDDDLTSFEVFSSLSSSPPGRSASSASFDRGRPSKLLLPPIKGQNLFTAKSRKAAREAYLKQLKEAASTSLPMQAVTEPRPRFTLKKPFDGWDLDTPVQLPLNARLPTLVDKIPRLISLAAKDEKKYNGPFTDLDSYHLPTGSPRTMTKHYLEHFGIMELFQFLLYTLVTNRPDKPMDFLVEMTRSILGQMKVHYDMARVFMSEPHLSEQSSVDSSVRKSFNPRHPKHEKT